MSISARSCVLWDGEQILGGEPEWFAEAARRDEIRRSAEGCGPLLFVKHAAGSIQIAFPGHWITLTENGDLIVEKNRDRKEDVRPRTKLRIVK